MLPLLYIFCCSNDILSSFEGRTHKRFIITVYDIKFCAIKNSILSLIAGSRSSRGHGDSNFDNNFLAEVSV